MGKAAPSERRLPRRQHGSSAGARSEWQAKSRETGMEQRLKWLLLRHAMNGAQAPDKISAVYAHDVALRKQTGKKVERYAIVRIVEGRHQNQSIGNIKVGVARG